MSGPFSPGQFKPAAAEVEKLTYALLASAKVNERLTRWIVGLTVSLAVRRSAIRFGAGRTGKNVGASEPAQPGVDPTIGECDVGWGAVVALVLAGPSILDPRLGGV